MPHIIKAVTLPNARCNCCYCIAPLFNLLFEEYDNYVSAWNFCHDCAVLECMDIFKGIPGRKPYLDPRDVPSDERLLRNKEKFQRLLDWKILLVPKCRKDRCQNLPSLQRDVPILDEKALL